jgi:membrane protease YdiL (CAAX protease family)
MLGALCSAWWSSRWGTILVEEIAFRSVLWGMLSRHMAAWRVLAISSVLFGLWHVLPSLHLAAANRGIGEAVSGTGASAGVLVVAGTVTFTALGGAVAGELRRRSGSLLASAGMHWATNGLGVLFGLVARHLVRLVSLPLREIGPQLAGRNSKSG